MFFVRALFNDASVLLWCVSAAQRSAQEYPRVENQDLECCSVLGGQQMILLGKNFTSESRVVFTEKTHGETN